MGKNNVLNRINGLNEYMLSNSNKQLLLLTTSSIYTYNKAIAIIEKNIREKDWFSLDDKHCFKTYDEIEAFLDGLCLGKNTNFYQQEQVER